MQVPLFLAARFEVLTYTSIKPRPPGGAALAFHLFIGLISRDFDPTRTLQPRTYRCRLRE